MANQRFNRCALAMAIFLLAAGTAAAQDEADPGTTETPATPGLVRLPPRPLLGDALYSALAAQLREQYAKPAKDWPAPTVDKDVKWTELGRSPRPQFPKENPFSREKAELGRMLFFDARLSAKGQMSCASCHEPNLGFSDGRQAAFGKDAKALKRNAPGLMNAAFGEKFFWDGRAASLEEQAAMAMTNPKEMAGADDHTVTQISALKGYGDYFKKAFGDEKVTQERATQAIATFVRTIVGGRSKFDQFVAGKTDALSDSALRGLHLFRTEARCMNCHHGPSFTDNQFHDLGLSYYGRELQDLGRYEITKEAKDVGTFKTPTLRNVMRTSPYMHIGLFEIDGVLNLYNAGMPTLRRKPAQKDDPLFPTKSPLLKPLRLNEQDKTDLKAFLEALNEPRIMVRAPKLPE